MTETTHPQPRMRHPAKVLPDAAAAIGALAAATRDCGVPEQTLALVHLRASQINGCGPCVDGAAYGARQAGASDERVFAVAAWRESPYFTEAQRAALSLTEAATRLSDRPDPVGDEVWEAAARHYDERGLAAIVLMTATANLLNRLNLPTRQIAGPWDRE